MREKRALTSRRMRISTENSHPSILLTAALMAVLAMLMGPRTAAALTALKGQLLNQGFQVFNTQTLTATAEPALPATFPKAISRSARRTSPP